MELGVLEGIFEGRRLGVFDGPVEGNELGTPVGTELG